MTTIPLRILFLALGILSVSPTAAALTLAPTRLGKTSFLVTKSHTLAPSIHGVTRHPRRSPRLSMIFERMSEECISSLVTAQTESARLAQSAVGCEVMTLGIIDHPERARKTLKSYGITLRKARLTVENMFRGDNDDVGAADANGNKGVLFTMSPQLLNMNKKARDVELPFAPALKRSLTLAGNIADSLQSGTVHSEHVLLALLGYDPLVGRVPDEIDAAVEERGYAKGALAVFLRMEGIDSTSFSSVEFCRRLIMDIKYPESADGPQLVTGKDGDLATPTLMQVGVDLTEAARRMELDPVSGRDHEIGAAVRTLVRRRKNNPWYVVRLSQFLQPILTNAQQLVLRFDSKFDGRARCW